MRIGYEKKEQSPSDDEQSQLFLAAKCQQQAMPAQAGIYIPPRPNWERVSKFILICGHCEEQSDEAMLDNATTSFRWQ